MGRFQLDDGRSCRRHLDVDHPGVRRPGQYVGPMVGQGESRGLVCDANPDSQPNARSRDDPDSYTNRDTVSDLDADAAPDRHANPITVKHWCTREIAKRSYHGVVLRITRDQWRSPSLQDKRGPWPPSPGPLDRPCRWCDYGRSDHAGCLVLDDSCDRRYGQHVAQALFPNRVAGHSRLLRADAVMSMAGGP